MICTVTSVGVGDAPVLLGENLRPHVHINAVGADPPGKVEIPLPVLKSALVTADHPEQARREGGSQQLGEADLGPDLMDLMALCVTPAPAARHRNRTTVFDTNTLLRTRSTPTPPRAIDHFVKSSKVFFSIAGTRHYISPWSLELSISTHPPCPTRTRGQGFPHGRTVVIAQSEPTFSVLGAMEIRGTHGKLPIGAHKQQVLLARLICQANRVVPVADLMDTLWGDRPPRTAEKIIQVYVHDLRKVLMGGLGEKGERITFVRPGYTLRSDPDEIDVNNFDRLSKEGFVLLLRGDYQAALSRLRQALRIWRGPAFLGLTESLFLSRSADSLNERLFAALGARIDAELCLGRHAWLVHELSQLVSDHPYREQFHGQLMLALYRSGRQSEALAAYQSLRRLLVEELGVEPHWRLRELHHAILDQRQDLHVAPRFVLDVDVDITLARS
nr:BTAD domain-containing putative transcriptional regulator [Streptomyces caeruleatus]